MSKAMTAAELSAAHMREHLREAGFEQWDTGGGCTALGLEAHGGQILVTSLGDEGNAPEDFPLLVGCYSKEGSKWQAFEVDDLAALTTLLRVIAPASIAIQNALEAHEGVRDWAY